MKYCPVYKKCGACQYINQDYKEQLQIKQNQIVNLFHGMKVQNIIGMQDPYHYRYKVYAAFTHDREGKITAGLYEESTHKVVHTDMCLIQNNTANHIIHSICEIATKMHIEAYSERTGRGVLRHAYIRISHQNNDVLLVLIIGSRALPGSHDFIRQLREKHPEIKTIILNYNHEHTSMILGDREKILFGPGYIEDSIQGISFRISSHSFYQVNPVQTQKLYSAALEMADLKKDDHVFDMCCGVGTISLCAAEKADLVIGVEINPDAVKYARENAKRNHISNVHFICDDAEWFMAAVSERPDVVFLDPPRAGFSAAFMHALGRMNPDRIVYISCNPETQARDTAVIYHDGYVIEQIVPVDMFPFTDKTENIVLLRKGKTRTSRQLKKSKR